ncbi:MAG TPA: hypothetical protein VKB58_17545 [Terriglobales bacterium]|nr:hypothetical protein [Terriglobales bacterium]
MTTFFLSSMLLLTIVGCFAIGIAAGYWAIRIFLNFFDPGRPRNKAAHAAALAPTTSGD